MDWKDLAPWIAIAITLILSILVPLFTQIANNNHQRKMQREKFEYEEKQKKIIAYEEFLLTVGAVIVYADKSTLPLAGSNIERIYLYAPKEWHEDLDSLFEFARKYEWKDAAVIMQKLNRLISEELRSTK